MASSSTGHSGRTEPPEGGRTPPVTLPSLLLGENGTQLGKGSTRHEKKAGGPKGGGGQGAAPLDAVGGDTSPAGEGPPRGAGQWEGDKTPQTEPTASLLSPDRAADLLAHGPSNNTLVKDQYSCSLEHL